jgi:hypothetical protein
MRGNLKQYDMKIIKQQISLSLIHEREHCSCLPAGDSKSEEMERDRSNSEDPQEVIHLVKRLNNNNTIANISEF